ncbi:UNVERIFIED_ORG: hypothetical protein ABIC48_001564 [Burkholderia territorii]
MRRGADADVTGERPKGKAHRGAARRATKTDESSVRDGRVSIARRRGMASHRGNRLAASDPRRYVCIRAGIGLKHGRDTILKRSPRAERIRPGPASCYPTGAPVACPAQQPLAARVSAGASGDRRFAQRGRRACASAMTSQFSRCSAQASASSSPTRASQPVDWVERSETLDVCMTKPHIGGELGITLIIAKRPRFVKCDFVI